MERDEYEATKPKELADPDNPQEFSVPNSLEYTRDGGYCLFTAKSNSRHDSSYIK